MFEKCFPYKFNTISIYITILKKGILFKFWEQITNAFYRLEGIWHIYKRSADSLLAGIEMIGEYLGGQCSSFVL